VPHLEPDEVTECHSQGRLSLVPQLSDFLFTLTLAFLCTCDNTVVVDSALLCISFLREVVIYVHDDDLNCPWQSAVTVSMDSSSNTPFASP